MHWVSANLGPRQALLAAALLAAAVLAMPGRVQAEDAKEAPAVSARELQTVEEEVNALKERTFRSKVTLELLRELVTEGRSVGARVAIWHLNELGGGYGVEGLQYFLDGRNVFNRADPEGSLTELKEIKVVDQPLPVGKHNLLVQLLLRGEGFKIFSYLQAYQLRVQSSYDFTVEDGRMTSIRVIANSRAGLRSFQERPKIEFDARVEQLQAP